MQMPEGIERSLQGQPHTHTHTHHLCCPCHADHAICVCDYVHSGSDVASSSAHTHWVRVCVGVGSRVRVGVGRFCYQSLLFSCLSSQLVRCFCLACSHIGCAVAVVLGYRARTGREALADQHAVAASICFKLAEYYKSRRDLVCGRHSSAPRPSPSSPPCLPAFHSPKSFNTYIQICVVLIQRPFSCLSFACRVCMYRRRHRSTTTRLSSTISPTSRPSWRSHGCIS